MKLFFKRILIFFGLFVLLFGGLEIWARKFFLTETDLFLKFRSLEEVKDSIEILVIGNSHLEKGINPDLFSKKAFNLAYSAQDLYYDNHVFKHYLPNLPELKYLFIGVDFLSFGYDESKTSMYYVRDYNKELKIRPRNGVSYLYLLNHSIFWINRAKFLKYIFSGFPSKNDHAFSFAIEEAKESNQEQVLMANGYRATWSSMSESEIKRDAEITASRGISLYNASLEEENMNCILEIIDLAYQKKIKVFVVSAPVSVIYKNLYPQKMQSHFDSLLTNIQVKYPDVLYINTMDDFAHEKDVFFNSNHLNSKGATAFTLYLEKLILKNQESSPYNYAD